MNRERATSLLVDLLTRTVTGGCWQLDVLRAVHVFGSYARGALQPGDVDLLVDIDRTDPRWKQHFLRSLSDGRDPYSAVRRALRGRVRGISLQFERDLHADIPITTLWSRGEPLAVALGRVRGIAVDPAAGRALRDAMLPCFEGIDDVLPRFLRQEIVELVDAETLDVDQVILPDASVDDLSVREVIERRWAEGSPLRRAAHAALVHLEAHGVDLRRVHLHGQDMDIDVPITPYFVGFRLCYLAAARHCFLDDHGVEWIEVVRPTRRQPLRALVLRRGRRFAADGWAWSESSCFR